MVQRLELEQSRLLQAISHRDEQMKQLKLLVAGQSQGPHCLSRVPAVVIAGHNSSTKDIKSLSGPCAL